MRFIQHRLINALFRSSFIFNKKAKENFKILTLFGRLKNKKLIPSNEFTSQRSIKYGVN